LSSRTPERRKQRKMTPIRHLQEISSPGPAAERGARGALRQNGDYPVPMVVPSRNRLHDYGLRTKSIRTRIATFVAMLDPFVAMPGHPATAPHIPRALTPGGALPAEVARSAANQVIVARTVYVLSFHGIIDHPCLRSRGGGDALSQRPPSRRA